jgi:hypothetical protein
MPIRNSKFATRNYPAIVAEIEAEQALVNANRELIARMEKKIQATLARVWGEDEAGPREPGRLILD